MSKKWKVCIKGEVLTYDEYNGDGDNTEDEWTLEDIEISVLKSTNTLGQISYGWSGKDKIILFEEVNEIFYSKEDAENHFNWMKSVADAFVEILNKKGL